MSDERRTPDTVGAGGQKAEGPSDDQYTSTIVDVYRPMHSDTDKANIYAATNSYEERRDVENATRTGPAPAAWVLERLRAFPDRRITFDLPKGDLTHQPGVVLESESRNSRRVAYRVAVGSAWHLQPHYRFYFSRRAAWNYAWKMSWDSGAAILAGRYQDADRNACWIDLEEFESRK